MIYDLQIRHDLSRCCVTACVRLNRYQTRPESLLCDSLCPSESVKKKMGQVYPLVCESPWEV